MASTWLWGPHVGCHSLHLAPSSFPRAAATPRPPAPASSPHSPSPRSPAPLRPAPSARAAAAPAMAARAIAPKLHRLRHPLSPPACASCQRHLTLLPPPYSGPLSPVPWPPHATRAPPPWKAPRAVGASLGAGQAAARPLAWLGRRGSEAAVAGLAWALGGREQGPRPPSRERAAQGESRRCSASPTLTSFPTHGEHHLSVLL